MKVHTGRKQLEVDEELREICLTIQKENKSLDDWIAAESDDMFQTASYCGGFEAVESEFCFSYYDESKREWWFQFSLEDIPRIIDGSLKFLDLCEAGKPPLSD